MLLHALGSPVVMQGGDEGAAFGEEFVGVGKVGEDAVALAIWEEEDKIVLAGGFTGVANFHGFQTYGVGFPGLFAGEAIFHGFQTWVGLSTEKKNAGGGGHGKLWLSLQGIKKGGECVHGAGGGQPLFLNDYSALMATNVRGLERNRGY